MTTPGCDHKFIDSNHCLKCGWKPPTSLSELEALRAASPAEPTRETPLPLSTLEQAIREALTEEVVDRIVRRACQANIMASVHYDGPDAAATFPVGEWKARRAAETLAFSRAVYEALAQSPLLAPRTAGKDMDRA